MPNLNSQIRWNPAKRVRTLLKNRARSPKSQKLAFLDRESTYLSAMLLTALITLATVIYGILIDKSS